MFSYKYLLQVNMYNNKISTLCNTNFQYLKQFKNKMFSIQITFKLYYNILESTVLKFNLDLSC